MSVDALELPLVNVLLDLDVPFKDELHGTLKLYCCLPRTVLPVLAQCFPSQCVVCVSEEDPYTLYEI